MDSAIASIRSMVRNLMRFIFHLCPICAQDGWQEWILISITCLVSPSKASFAPLLLHNVKLSSNQHTLFPMTCFHAPLHLTDTEVFSWFVYLFVMTGTVLILEGQIWLIFVCSPWAGNTRNTKQQQEQDFSTLNKSKI